MRYRAPSNGVGGLRDVRVNQWPAGSLCLPIGHCGKNKTVSVQFSSVTSLCTRFYSLN